MRRAAEADRGDGGRLRGRRRPRAARGLRPDDRRRQRALRPDRPAGRLVRRRLRRRRCSPAWSGPKKAKEIWFLCRQYDAAAGARHGARQHRRAARAARGGDRRSGAARCSRSRRSRCACSRRASTPTEDGLAGIQQLAHDANLLFYASRGGAGGPRRLPREAPARLLASSPAAVAAVSPARGSGSWPRGRGRCRRRWRRCSSAPRWPARRGRLPAAARSSAR